MFKKRRLEFSLFADSDPSYHNDKKETSSVLYSRNDGRSNVNEAVVEMLDNHIYFTGKVNTDSVTYLIKQINPVIKH